MKYIIYEILYVIYICEYSFSRAPSGPLKTNLSANQIHPVDRHLPTTPTKRLKVGHKNHLLRGWAALLLFKSLLQCHLERNETNLILVCIYQHTHIVLKCMETRYIRLYILYTTFGCSDSIYLLRPSPHFYIVLFLVIVYHKLPQILIFLLISLWKDSWNLQALLREIWCIRPKPSPSTPWPQHLQTIGWRPFHTLPPFMTQWKMTLLWRNWLFRKHPDVPF